MTANVNQEQCIGCGLCVGMAPEVFRMNDNGLSEAFGEVTEANKGKKAKKKKEMLKTVILERVYI